MDWLTFISNIVTATAWPLATLAIALLLRSPMSKAIGLISRVKFSEVEVEFERQLTAAKEEASSELPTETFENVGLPASVDDHVIKLAGVSPRAAVLESWRQVESAALTAAENLLGAEKFKNKTMTFQAISTIERSTTVPERIVDLLRRLRSLRNQAAHSSEFSLSATSAIEYARLASQVVAYLQGITSAQGTK